MIGLARADAGARTTRRRQEEEGEEHGEERPLGRKAKKREAAAAEAAAKRSLARHVDTLTDVRKQKAEKRALQGQLDRTRLVLGRTRHKLTATLNHPPAMHKASAGVTKERRRRRRPVDEQPSVRRRADEEPSWRSSATAPSRQLMEKSSVFSVPSTFAPAPAPAPA